MLRNRGEDGRQRQAAEDLKRISECHWGEDKIIEQTPEIPSKINNFVNTSFQFKKSRPRTQQNLRRQKASFLVKSRTNRLKSMFTDLKVDETVKYRLSCHSTPFSEKEKSKSGSKEKRLLEKRNYSELRKHIEEEFYIGSKSTTLGKKTLQNLSGTKNLRKGRLWLGRPLIINFPEKEKEKSRNFFMSKNTR